MIEKLVRSDATNIGYKFSGAITKADYAVLVPELETELSNHPTVNLLCDLTDFTWEKPSAWSADLKFGHEFHHKIKKMAIVGDGECQKLIADIAHPFYAQESKYFDNVDAAWEWFEDGAS